MKYCQIAPEGSRGAPGEVPPLQGSPADRSENLRNFVGLYGFHWIPEDFMDCIRFYRIQ